MKLIANIERGRHIHRMASSLREEGCEMTLHPGMGPYVEISVRDALFKNLGICSCIQDRIFEEDYLQTRSQLTRQVSDLEALLI